MLVDFDLHHFLQGLSELLRDSGIKDSYTDWAEFFIVTAGLLGSTGIIGYLTARRKFRNRFFFDQMVVGVNTLEQGEDGVWRLKLRTLIEDNLQALLDNPELERLVSRAAKRCTDEVPIIKLKDREDHALLLTKVQNAISRCFAKEYMEEMLGKRFKKAWVDFVVTCERYGGLKATKIRVLVFRREDVRRLLDARFAEGVVVEAAHHSDRIRTLALIAKTQLVGTDIVYGRVEVPIAAL